MTELHETWGEEPHQENHEKDNLNDGHIWVDMNNHRHS